MRGHRTGQVKDVVGTWFAVVVSGVFALAAGTMTTVGVVGEFSRSGNWRRRTGLAVAVLAGWAALLLAVSQVSGIGGGLCGSAVGILTETPDPSTLGVDELTRASMRACIQRRQVQLGTATSLMGAAIGSFLWWRRIGEHKPSKGFLRLVWPAAGR